jgi:succinoglycan biosynthesis transport protein ExoP
MDGIQPYAGAPRPVAYPVHPSHGFGFGPPTVPPGSHDAIPSKSPSDYIRAIRRRSWLVVSIALLVSVAGALLVLRMPAVYKTAALVTIEPPSYDQFLMSIISKADHSLIGPSSEESDRAYVADKLMMLRSKAIIDTVVRDPSLNGGQPVGPLDDPAADLGKNLYWRNQPGTHYYTISLEGGDPSKVTRTLHLLLDVFKSKAQNESKDILEGSKQHANQQIRMLAGELTTLHTQIYELAQKTKSLGPDGANITKEQLQQVNQALLMERVRYGELQRSLRLESLRPTAQDPRAESRANRIAGLEQERGLLVKRYTRAKQNTRDRDDPYLRGLVQEIRDIDDKVARLSQPDRATEMANVDDSEVILASAQAEIQSLEQETKRLTDQMQQSLPDYDKFANLVFQREQKQGQMATVMQNYAEFEALSNTQKDPVKIVDPPAEPVSPDRPKRGLYIAGFIVFGLALGMGCAFLLEHVDHSVKVPEHLTHGLSLPLLGVVPRIRRTAKIHRGGHLWTPGLPDSIEADAYRNIRASLLGVAGSHGPIVTLLVTSAKAGEGKSTTALNLAATCARAGERTLLVDVDLRRPSLADVFPHDDKHLGLVDVLRGDLPWQRVVVPSDLPNLDFIPTGDTRDVPIEILGSLELRQLLLSLSQHHYDRVILDGPAILGLADCRMLGRIVDAAVMVVRSGTMQLRPLRRAKAMLEQSQVKMAGVVFNGLSDDLDNWSSYGPAAALDDLGAFGPARAISSAAGASATLDS